MSRLVLVVDDEASIRQSLTGALKDEGSQLMALFALCPERYQSYLKEHPGRINTKDRTVLKFIPQGVSLPKVVVDACAGAGGKSIAMADALKGQGRVFAYDTSEKKLQALRRRATHAGLNNIQAIALKEGAEAEAIQKFKETANVVLVDAPCSGWGVLRRNPDIKWRQTEDVLKKMPEIQFRLLSIYSELVAPGGRLVYGVCTFRMAETRDIVRQFLDTHPQFELKEGGYLGPGPCDGFFMQAFVKRDEKKK